MLKNRGFTLLEILVVVIILGILASLAIPVYSNQMTKAYAHESYLILHNIREAATLYYHDPNKGNGDYVDMTLDSINFDPNATSGGQVRHFNYTFQTVNPQNFVARAVCSVAGKCAAADYIDINQNGQIVPNPAGKFA